MYVLQPIKGSFEGQFHMTDFFIKATLPRLLYLKVRSVKVNLYATKLCMDL